MSIVGLDVGLFDTVGTTVGVNETEGLIDEEGNWVGEAESLIEGLIDAEGGREGEAEGLIEGLIDVEG